MRSILIGAITAAGFVIVTTAPSLSAPAIGSGICKAAARVTPVTQARCWCSYRAFSGRCERWRCR
jgi:hypothetical protein